MPGIARVAGSGLGVWALALAAAAAGASAQAPPGFRCVAGEIHSVPPDDARTAVDFVCREVARESGGAGEYSVDLRPLGRAVIVTLLRAAPADSRTLRLDSIEEVPVAAPRLAEALVHGRPLDDTRRVDNLVASETRYTPLRKGRVRPSFGILGLSLAGHGAPLGAGFALGLEYVTPRFAIPGELRYAHGGGDGAAASNVFSLSTGGRWYASPRGTSPYVGGGISMLWVGADDSYAYDYEGDRFYGSSFGVAPYVEGGVELLRLHRARLRLGLRVDIPTRDVRSYGFCDYDFETRTCIDHPARTRYVVPITFGVSVSF